MRRDAPNDGSWCDLPRRMPRASWWLALAALAAATGCAAIRPRAESVDLAPLLEVQTEPSTTLLPAFPDYEALVLAGVPRTMGGARPDGVVDRFAETYDWEQNVARSWSIDVSVTLFDTAARAVRDLDSSCNSFAVGGAWGPIRWEEGLYCVSTVMQRPTDPRNNYTLADFYTSWVFVRRDRIVLRLYERHKDSPKSAKNQIIVELAERLSRLNASASTR